jgi:outer membrane protein assembly factor BamB
MKHLTCLLTIVLLATVCILSADDDRRDGARAYVASASNQFGAANPNTGDFMLIGFTSSLLSGLAIGPQKAIYGLDADNNLVTINPRTAMTKVVGNIGLPIVPNENVTLFTSLSNGKLFALDPSNKLYSINSSNGHAKLIGSTGIPVPNLSTCNCVTANSLAGAEGHLYFTFEVVDLASGKSTTPSALYRIDSYTGAATRVGPTHAHAPIVGSGFIDGTLYGFTFGMAVSQPNQILAIDLETGTATFITNQASNLDVVFGAISVNERHDGFEH